MSKAHVHLLLLAVFGLINWERLLSVKYEFRLKKRLSIRHGAW